LDQLAVQGFDYDFLFADKVVHHKTDPIFSNSHDDHVHTVFFAVFFGQMKNLIQTQNVNDVVADPDRLLAGNTGDRLLSISTISITLTSGMACV